MLAKTFSATPFAVEGTLVSIEAIQQELPPQIHITGLPGDVVKESRERVRACLNGLGIETPTSRILIHLSPAHRKKMGAQLDLGIAMSIVALEGLLDCGKIKTCGFLGELSLDGTIRGASAAAILVERMAKEDRIEVILVPAENEFEASIVGSPKTFLVERVSDAIEFLNGRLELPRPRPFRAPEKSSTLQLDRVEGQILAKRALEISLAGRHHFLMMGPPGVGKSLLASCAPSLLPEGGARERLEIAKNHAYAPEHPDHYQRPFRSPHHSISAGAFLGGGSGMVLPGEVTLSDHGVLFMDELPEFRRDVIEGLREPLEARKIFLHRVGESLTLPADFILLSAMNPCPCGYSSFRRKPCVCGPEKISAYRRKISGPLLERFDLFVLFTPGVLSSTDEKNRFFSHVKVRDRINAAWERQRDRYGELSSKFNGHAKVDEIPLPFQPVSEGKSWLDQLGKGDRISYRSYHKLLRIARTIADLEGAEVISLKHLLEAHALRPPPSLMEI